MKNIPVGKKKFAVVDDEDAETLLKYTWWLTSSGYAEGHLRVGKKGMKHGVCRTGPKVLMHRLLLDATKGHDVDHVNMDLLDNRRANLRLATRSQNMANSGSRVGSTSQFKGVYWSTAEKSWMAALTFNGKVIWRKKFKEEVDAATAYNFKALEHFGEFAYMNKPL